MKNFIYERLPFFRAEFFFNSRFFWQITGSGREIQSGACRFILLLRIVGKHYSAKMCNIMSI
ncbi:MAG: hypothetical protein VB106_09030 [Clostridiaceae bacterium]|nr:hypothetical protein [Clostridiaceae bacterium]